MSRNVERIREELAQLDTEGQLVIDAAGQAGVDAITALHLLKAGWRPLSHQRDRDGVSPEPMARSCGQRHVTAWTSVEGAEVKVWVAPTLGDQAETVEVTVDLLEQLVDEGNGLRAQLASLLEQTHGLHRDGPVALCPTCTP